MRRTILILSSAILASAAQAAEPTGDWRVQDGSAIIRIDNCSGALWGVVTWERTPGRDEHNPNPNLRNRPTLGSAVVMNMRPKAQGSWAGRIYNAQNGQTYNANLKMQGDNRLRVEGCVLGGVFCGGQQWSRVSTTSGSGSRNGGVCSRVSNLSGPPH